MSKNQNHINHLNTCMEFAKESVINGNHPFGAIIVLNDKVVVTSQNEVNTKKDVTAHAEMLLVQKAQKVLSEKELSICTLYTSTEPCAMCSGAIYWAGITKVIYGCSTNQLFKIVNIGLSIPARDIFDNGTREIQTMSFSDEAMYSNIHKRFWK